MGNERKIEEEMRRKQKNREREKSKTKKKKKRDEYEDEERDRKKKKKKKKKKRRKKDDGCSTSKCCKCLFKLSSICFIIEFLAGIAGAYFYFLQNDDKNIYAFASWSGAVVALVFGIC